MAAEGIAAAQTEASTMIDVGGYYHFKHHRGPAVPVLLRPLGRRANRELCLRRHVLDLGKRQGQAERQTRPGIFFRPVESQWILSVARELRRDLPDRALIVIAAGLCGAEQVAGAVDGYAADRNAAVVMAGEVMQAGIAPGAIAVGRELEDRALVIRPVVGGAVEIARAVRGRRLCGPG